MGGWVLEKNKSTGVWGCGFKKKNKKQKKKKKKKEICLLEKSFPSY
jgi:hypothetical protein